jgi:serine phosphatase RsbU (regulator of sigma subunit)
MENGFLAGSFFLVNQVAIGFRCVGFLSQNEETEPHPIEEFLFGFEEEGYVFYPVEHRDYFFWITGIAILLLFGFSFVLFLNRRSRIRLEQKNKEIVQINQKLTDSITYAGRIQQALLPDSDRLKKILPQSFVFFRPRDIVSGDFYWVTQAEEHIWVVVFDCTGHGVPGAFLTLLGYQEIRKLVNEKKVENPSDLLFQLHQNFVSAMNLENEDFRADGMEVSVCRLSPETRELTFSGAQLPLVLVENGEAPVVVKGQRFGIGSAVLSRANSNPFEDSRFLISPSTTCYLSTDGFPDQFGGKHDKKFLFKNQVNLFQELQSHTLENQSARLQFAFESWKETRPQTDDVLVLGFRF